MISRETIQRGFPIKPLGEVAEFLDSRRRPITASERIPGPYPYYGANGQQDSVESYIFDEPLILLAEDGGRFDQPDRGIAYAIEGKTWVNNHAHVLRPRVHAQLRYLVRVLENYDVTPWITGSTRAKLTKAGASKIQIPLPPLAEQKRIARILDAADAFRVKRREALAQLDTLIQSTFFDMFGDPVANPMGWEMATIGEVTTCLDRLRQPVKEADRVNGNIPYYGANGQQGWISEALFNEPLVLVAEDGGHFGDPARGVAYRIDGPSWVNNHAHVLRPAKTVDIEYLHRALRHYDFGPYISGSTRAKLNQTQLNKARFPLPPLDRQRRFAAIIESVEQQRASQRAHLAELDTLFASLQSRAFRGDL